MAISKSDLAYVVLLCLETFEAGYDTNKKLVEIHWSNWEADPTHKIRCVFQPMYYSAMRCTVYPTIQRTHGADIGTGKTWFLDD